MTNPDEEARIRRGAADTRLKAARKIRETGSWMMVAGATLFAGAIAAFAGFDSMHIPTWTRQVILTIIAILFSGGMVFYVVGRTLKLVLGQMADDRAERAAQHDEVMAELRQIRRNQSFLMARPGAAGTPSEANVTYRVKESPVSADTLNDFRKWRAERAGQAEERPDGRTPERDVVDPKYLADMSEAVRLGEELAKRKFKPPDQPSTN